MPQNAASDLGLYCLLSPAVPILRLNTAFYYLLMCLKTAGWVANSVDPDQMPQNVASDLGLYCLLGHAVPILWINMVEYKDIWKLLMCGLIWAFSVAYAMETPFGMTQLKLYWLSDGVWCFIDFWPISSNSVISRTAVSTTLKVCQVGISLDFHIPYFP